MHCCGIYLYQQNLGCRNLGFGMDSNVEMIKLCYFGVFARYQFSKIYHGFYDAWTQDSMLFGPCCNGKINNARLWNWWVCRGPIIKNLSQFLLCSGSSFNPSLTIVVVNLIMQDCGIK
jgi:hypothetical protein